MTDSRFWLSTVLVAATLIWPISQGVMASQNRREQFYAYDFAHNIFRSAERDSVVVAKKDVQLYALWHFQGVEGHRPDVKVIAQGLAGSLWYQAGWRHRDASLTVSALTHSPGWLALAQPHRAVYATQDAEIPSDLSAQARAQGLLMSVSPLRAQSADLWEFIFRRGPHHYGETPDFFTSDLIDSLAAASYRRAVDLNKDGLKLDAEKRFLDAWRMNWIFPEVPLFMGYAAAISGDWAQTARLGAIADRLFAKKIELANNYRALAEVKNSIRRQAAEAATQRGVALEKMGQRDDAMTEYRYALALFPLAQTRYDLAVLDWGRDWKSVEDNLSEALRLDPNHADARRYLAMLQARRR